MRRVLAACTASVVALAPTLVLLSAFVVVKTIFIAPGPAIAQTTPTATPTATPSPTPSPSTATTRCNDAPQTESRGEASKTNLRRGEKVRITGSGFKSNADLTIDFCQPTNLGSGKADANGRYDFEVKVPADATAGSHRFIVTGDNTTGGRHRSIVDVAILAGSLPATGSSAKRDILWAFALLTAGEAFIAGELWARRRRRARASPA